MRLRRWSELAREAPDAPAIVTRDRTLSRTDVLRAIEARETSDAPIALVGSVTVDAVLDLLAAIDRGAPVLLLHPRWTDRERALVLARLGSVDTRARGDDRALAIVHTSGTTGTPRGAVLSRRAFLASARASAAHLGHAPTDRWLLSMPLAHVGGLGIVVRSLAQETPLVVMEGGFDAVGFLELATAARVTHVSVVPTMLALLLDATDARPWPGSIERILVGGAACPESILERALAAGLPIHATYGLTETCGQVATRRVRPSSNEDARTLDPLPGVEVRVIDDVLSVRTPSLFDGWLGDPIPPTDDAGFYDTGDLGELVSGRVVVHVRRTDLIVTGGENVYPREVEDALERMHGVRAACVFGVPDVRWGQRVAAAVVLTEGTDEQDVLDGLRLQLAAYKTPRLLARLDALPLGATGKLDRRATASLALPLLRPLGAA
jgi:O-succinylbenzoic acid--CoA ligase